MEAPIELLSSENALLPLAVGNDETWLIRPSSIASIGFWYLSERVLTEPYLLSFSSDPGSIPSSSSSLPIGTTIVPSGNT